MTKKQLTIHVGIDVSKDKLAVAIAGGGVRDEDLSLGTFENTPASVDRLLKKLSGRGLPVSVCYEAEPTGYGLYRQVRAFGFECCVVAPAAPVTLADGRKLPLHPVRRTAFHLAHQVRDRQLRRHRDKHVDVIARQHAAQDVDIVLTADLTADVAHAQPQIPTQDLIVILGRPDDVIAVIENAVAADGVSTYDL